MYDMRMHVSRSLYDLDISMMSSKVLWSCFPLIRYVWNEDQQRNSSKWRIFGQRSILFVRSTDEEDLNKSECPNKTENGFGRDSQWEFLHISHFLAPKRKEPHRIIIICGSGW